MLLTIDVGNTNVKIGVFKGEELRATWNLFTDASLLKFLLSPPLNPPP